MKHSFPEEAGFAGKALPQGSQFTVIQKESGFFV
jgi:hypothetical protein